MKNETNWIKKCPKCGNTQTYKNKKQYQRGIRRNTLCYLCSGENRRIDLIGKRCGRLTVLSYDDDCHWKCRCDCGNIKSVRGHYITTGNIKSCGCWRREISERGHKPFQSLYKRLCWQSGKEGKNVTFSFDDFLKFTKTDRCHYCGDKIVWHGRNRGRYNLDRKDNAVGYSKENCVVCCKECNYAKNNHFTYDEMLIIGKAIGEVKRNRQSTFHLYP